MKALVKYREGQGNTEIQEVPMPETGPSDVLVKVVSAGLCGTDMEIYYGQFKTVTPVVTGYEGSGIVVEVGEEIRHIKPGDRVCSETSRTICGNAISAVPENTTCAMPERGLVMELTAPLLNTWQ